MKKVFFLDTNVLIHDPDCIFKFKDNDVIIPIFVIEELDNLKQRNDVVGFNSRKASRNIDSLRQFGFLMDWVDLSNGGRFKIELNGHSNSDAGKTDNKLLNVVINYAKKIERNVILISKDLNLRIKASAHGICSQDYTNDVIDLTTFYTGYVDFLLDSNN